MIYSNNPTSLNQIQQQWTKPNGTTPHPLVMIPFCLLYLHIYEAKSPVKGYVLYIIISDKK